jgi:hypothetical protein
MSIRSYRCCFVVDSLVLMPFSTVELLVECPAQNELWDHLGHSKVTIEGNGVEAKEEGIRREGVGATIAFLR